MPSDDKKKFEEDTETAFTLPNRRELSQDQQDQIDGVDDKRADSAIDDLEIEVDEEELKAESESPGRKY